MENENTKIEESKTAEQIQAEQYLNNAIKDEQPQQEQQAEPIYNNDAAQTGLYGLLSLIPIGLNIAGLPRTAAIWSEGQIKALSAGFIPVFRKYTWGQKAIVFLETGGGIEEIALVAVLAPLAIATYSEYSQEVANHKEAEKEVKSEVHNADTPLKSTFQYTE